MAKSMGVIEEALDDGDRAAAFRWYALNTHHHAAEIGPLESIAVVEKVRCAMRTVLEEIVASGERSTAEAEEQIQQALAERD
jgi:hypothetical protein